MSLPPNSKTRSVETPAPERLSAREAAVWCGIDEKDWMELARHGVIPPGARVSRQRRWWSWEEVMAVETLLQHLLELLVKKKRELRKAQSDPKVVPPGGKVGRSGAPTKEQ